MTLHTALQWLKFKINQFLNPQKTISSSRTGHKASIVRIWENVHCGSTALHCISHYIFFVNLFCQEIGIWFVLLCFSTSQFLRIAYTVTLMPRGQWHDCADAGTPSINDTCKYITYLNPLRPILELSPNTTPLEIWAMMFSGGIKFASTPKTPKSESIIEHCSSGVDPPSSVLETSCGVWRRRYR